MSTPDNSVRLFIICKTCGTMEHMAPTEWRAGGDAHYFVHFHRQNECADARYLPATISFDSIDGLYALSETRDRVDYLVKNDTRLIEADGGIRA